MRRGILFLMMPIVKRCCPNTLSILFCLVEYKASAFSAWAEKAEALYSSFVLQSWK
jgi:hypothetical protein